MARPKKNNADYFPHDADMRNDPKIRALRRTYGLEGYAIWNMYLENLTDSDFFKYEWNKTSIELLAGDFEIEPQKLEDIISYCQKVNLLTSDGEKIYTKKLIERFETVLQRRKSQRKKTVEEFSPPIILNNGVSEPENPQSKVNESKVNILSEEYEEKELLTDWKKCRKAYKNLPTNIIRLETREKNLFIESKKDFSRDQFQKAMKGLFKQEQINYTSMITRPFHFLERVETYLNAFESNDFKLYGAKPLEQ